MKSLKSLLVASLFIPALALAQPKTADEWYKEGETQYNLGNFDGAADAFKQGFASETDDSKKPAYLYNVAQAYRQGGKCKDAAFFYKRYLSLKDQDTVKPLKPEKRAEIEQRIGELEECAKNQGGGTTTTTGTGTGTKTGTGTTTTTTTGTGTKTGTGTGTGTGTTTTTTGTGTKTGTPTTTGTKTQPTRITATKADPTPNKPKKVAEESEEEGGEEEEVTTTVNGEQPMLVSARFIAGGSRVGMGDVDVGMRGAFGVIGGYPVLRQEKLLVEAGVAFSFTPVPFKNNVTGGSGTAGLTNALVNAAATYTVMPKVGVRGDVGLGVLSMSGINKMGSPFTEGGLGTTGPLTMLAFRLGVSADYQITPNIVATATPFALSVSPAKSGLREDIGTITQIQFMLGVGYRM